MDPWLRKARVKNGEHAMFVRELEEVIPIAHLINKRCDLMGSHTAVDAGDGSEELGCTWVIRGCDRLVQSFSAVALASAPVFEKGNLGLLMVA